MNKFKRLTLLCGHYGSGKTNVAVNLAFYLKEQYNNVVVADLDIVNPYFRTKDSIDDFKARGIELICSEYANTNVDIPALPANMYRLTADKDITAVIDVGGDDRGAYALGRLVPEIKAEKTDDFWRVTITMPYEIIKKVYGITDIPSGYEFYGNAYKCGDDCDIPHYGMWNGATCEKPDFHRPEFFGKFIVE